VTERAIFAAVALLIVGLALITMGGLHQNHYRTRKLQLLVARIDAIEKIISGDHDF
jgi:hypothetical protein